MVIDPNFPMPKDSKLIEWVQSHHATIGIDVRNGVKLWTVSWRDRKDDKEDEQTFGITWRDAVKDAMNHLRYDDIHPSQR